MPTNNPAPPRMPPPDKSIFEFRDIVSTWSIADIRGPETIAVEPRLPQYGAWERLKYYETFKPLILSEARAILKEGLVLYDNGKSPKSLLKISYVATLRSGPYPTELTMNGDLHKEFDLKTEVILLKSTISSQITIGFISIDRGSLTRAIKVKCASFTPEKPDASWEVYSLGSLVTLNRQYEACIRGTLVKFEKSFISANESCTSYSLAPEPHASSLNPPQIAAIDDFIKLDTGLKLLQGPPGTGKTTTIVELIKALVVNKERVLVCAPSNKAVQILAKRFLEQNPETPIIFAGREEKLPEDLTSVFLDAWRNNLINDLKILTSEIDAKREELNELLANETTPTNLEVPLNIFEVLIERYKAIISKVIRYDIYGQTGLKDVTGSYSEYNRGEISNLIRLVSTFGLFGIHVNKLLQHFEKIDNIEAYLLKNSKVVFCTLSTAGQQRMGYMNITSLIVDEAAQATEADTIIPFQRAPKKCLLVGDTSQLPAVVISDAARLNHYDWSMMYRLKVEAKYPCSMLTIQYRMHPRIRSWPSKRFYENKLMDGPEIELRPGLALPALIQPYVFINSTEPEERIDKTTRNPREADFVIRMLRYLKSKDINLKQQVGVISFYAGQVECINRGLVKAGIKDIQAQTVDGFQGDEKDIIIISFVRSNSGQRVGFLGDFRRLNVAVTRAKMSLIMIGNRNTLVTDENLKSLLDDAAQAKMMFNSQYIAQTLWPAPVIRQQGAAVGQRAVPTPQQHRPASSHQPRLQAPPPPRPSAPQSRRQQQGAGRGQLAAFSAATRSPAVAAPVFTPAASSSGNAARPPLL